MSNTFSIEVSKALRAIGVEGETERQLGKIAYKDEWEICDCIDVEYHVRGHFVPAYTLHDILRLMPKIGEKMGWGETELYDPITGKEFLTMYYKWMAQNIWASFMKGDYPKAEQYLMSIITKDHE